MKPVLEKLAAQHTAAFDVFLVDVDTSSDLVTHFGIRTMPTFVFFQNNKVVYVLKGAAVELLTQAFELMSIFSQK